MPLNKEKLCILAGVPETIHCSFIFGRNTKQGVAPIRTLARLRPENAVKLAGSDRKKKVSRTWNMDLNPPERKKQRKLTRSLLNRRKSEEHSQNSGKSKTVKMKTEQKPSPFHDEQEPVNPEHTHEIPRTAGDSQADSRWFCYKQKAYLKLEENPSDIDSGLVILSVFVDFPPAVLDVESDVGIKNKMDNRELTGKWWLRQKFICSRNESSVDRLAALKLNAGSQ